MKPRRLSEDEFKAAMTSKMRNVQESAADVLDIWSYVHSVPSDDLKGHVIYEPFVDGVYRTEDDHFDHVMVMTKTLNVYLVVVVDLPSDSFQGHRLLDLNQEYGLS